MAKQIYPIEFTAISKKEIEELKAVVDAKTPNINPFLEAIKALEIGASIRIPIPIKSVNFSGTQAKFGFSFGNKLSNLCKHADIPVKKLHIGNLIIITKLAHHN